MSEDEKALETYVHDCGHRYVRTSSEKPLRRRLTAICGFCFDAMPVVDDTGRLYRYVSIDAETPQEAIYRS